MPDNHLQVFEKMLDVFHILPRHVKDEILTFVKKVSIKKGDHILKLGAVEKYSVVLYSGVARAYQIKDGKGNIH